MDMSGEICILATQYLTGALMITNTCVPQAGVKQYNVAYLALSHSDRFDYWLLIR